MGLHATTLIRIKTKSQRGGVDLSRMPGSRSCRYEDLCLLGYDTVKVNVPENIPPQSSGKNNKPSKKSTKQAADSHITVQKCCDTFLHDLLFDLEHGGEMFLRNVG
jgi:hypothetical protein